MAFDHLSRHQGRLDIVCPCLCGHEYHYAEENEVDVVS
jgi:hypothetical protein